MKSWLLFGLWILLVPLNAFAAQNGQVESNRGTADTTEQVVDGMDFASLDDLDAYFASMSEVEAIDFQIWLLTRQTDSLTWDQISAHEDYLWAISSLSNELYGKPINELSWQDRESLIESAPSRQLFAKYLADSGPDLQGCDYVGSTAYDPVMTENAGYDFQGHTAIYFRVDGQANCYRKTCKNSTWGGDCGDGKIPYWALQCKDGGCPWYRFNGGKYVKDVLMLVPTRWWYAWLFPGSYKASWFTVYWRYDRPNGCCDPGC